jgi:hypothetical protein
MGNSKIMEHSEKSVHRWTLLILAVLAVVLTNFSAQPAVGQSPTAICKDMNTGVGKGMRLVKSCSAANLKINPFDSYYQVVVEVTPAAGFGDQARFDRKSAQGKVLSGLMDAVFSREKATGLDLTLNVTQGAATYPPRSLMSFEYSDKRWQSNVTSDARTLLHRISINEDFQIRLNYAYSEKSSIDFNAATGLIQSTGLKVITPATQPVLAAANTLANSILRANDITVATGTAFSLSPSAAGMRNVEQHFEVVDPREGTAIATIRVRLQGTQSLFAPPAAPEALQSALPTGAVTMPELDSLSRQIATGQAQNWGILNGALAAASLGQVPLGREPTRAELKGFCNSAESGLASNYLLSPFDNLLVRAKLLEAASLPLQRATNPYKICFSDDQRTLIRTHLGLDTEFAEVNPAELRPMMRHEALAALGCFFAGKEGDYCGTAAEVRQQVRDLLAENIVVGPLEGVSVAEVYADLPASRTLTRDQFLARFGSRFASFFGINASAGSVGLRETANGTQLRLTGEVDAAGKLKRISTSRP